MKPLQTLQQLIAGWPAEGPQTLTEIWNASTSELPQAAVELRRHLVDVRNSFDAVPIVSPEDVRALLERRLLRPVAGGWLTVPLDAERRRVLTTHVVDDAVPTLMEAAVSGDVRAFKRALSSPHATRKSWAAHLSRQVPSIEVLAENVPVDSTGGYLLVYGGSPESALAGRTSEKLAELLRAAPVVDVVFWQLSSARPPTCFSLGVGRGECAGDLVEFPSELAQTAARLRAVLNKEER